MRTAYIDEFHFECYSAQSNPSTGGFCTRALGTPPKTPCFLRLATVPLGGARVAEQGGGPQPQPVELNYNLNLWLKYFFL